MSQVPLQSSWFIPNSSPNAQAFGSNVAAGSVITVGIRFNSIPSAITVVGSLNGSYTQRGTTQTIIGALYLAVFDFVNSGAGAETITVTWTGGGSIHAEAVEIPGCSATPYDSSGSAAAVSASPGTTASTGATGTRSQAAQIQITFVATEGANTFTAAGGGTLFQAGSDTTIQGQYQIFASTGTDAGQITLGSSDNWGAACVGYKAAGGAVAPTVTTSAATVLNATNATGNGNVTSDGGATITERGFVWATTSNPTTANNKVTASGTTGAYTAVMDIGTTGAVLPSTTYHYRAYAINSVGTSYGSDTTFTTIAPQNFSDERCLIAKNMHSAQSEAGGWNVTVLAALYANLGNITRVSPSIAQVVLPAVAGYAITAQETITGSTDTTMTTGANALTGTPTITVNP